MSHKIRRLCFVGGWLVGLFGLMLPVVWAANLGEPDPTFGVDGSVTITFEETTAVHDMAIQPDGKIVVVGEIWDFESDTTSILVARYTPTGMLDDTFGNQGLVNLVPRSGSGVAIQPDGKIIVTGRILDSQTLHVTRYDPAGNLDSQFGQSGIVTTTFTDHFGGADVALDEQGNILVVATSGDPKQLTLIRYTSNGNIDTSFATNGIALLTMDSTFDVYGNSVAVQPDRQILVAGHYVSSIDSSSVPLIARYDTMGDLDDSFGNGGIVTSTVSGQAAAYDLTLQPDGKIVVTGGNGPDYPTNRLLLRYGTDGSLDDTFINDEVLVISDERTLGAAVAIQPGGKIVVAGDQRLTRHHPDGSLDTSFGLQGVMSPLGRDSWASAMAVQPDGQILVGGTFGLGWVQGFITRYIGDLPPTFPTNNPATGSPLITPTQGVSLTTARPPFDWEDATDDVSVTHYTLQLTPSNQALTLQESTAYTTPVSNYTPTADLANGSYTWTVQAHDLVGHVTSILTPAHFTIAVEEQDDTERVYLPLVLK